MCSAATVAIADGSATAITRRLSFVAIAYPSLRQPRPSRVKSWLASSGP
jgi:hypothetical protein